MFLISIKAYKISVVLFQDIEYLIINEFNYLGILFNRTGNLSETIKKQAE
jgi:hypothetical protein